MSKVEATRDTPRRSFGKSLGKFVILTVATIVSVVLAIVGVALTAWWIWHSVPAYSAEMQIPNSETHLTLKFYNTEDENRDPGRYLTIRTPNAIKTIPLTAFDWTDYPSTEVYLAPDRKKVAVGESGAEGIVIEVDKLSFWHARGASHDWTYLGRFDFEVTLGVRERKLVFVAATHQD
jgi:hypothetical protein